MSYLEYQDEMYTSAVEDDACLIITSKGIGLEHLMVRLCRTYSDETNLVIIIGTNPDEELYFTNKIVEDKDVPYGKIPQRITAESSNTKKRTQVYLQGGVMFVTARILVVDLLCDRVPIHLVTGIIVYNAHKIFDDCIMSFIMRLYRMKNKKGFVKALSQRPQSFFGDYGKLDKIMRALFVTSLHLWPRFHASVQSSLDSVARAQPEVIQFDLPMTQTLKNLQFDIMDLIDLSLKELSKTNTAFLYDSDQLNVENAIQRSFDGFIKKRFDEIWHQLSTKAKRLINDIQWLRNMLNLLTQSDAVAFYNQTLAARNSVRFGCEVSDWISSQPAARLFKLAAERLYPHGAKIVDFEAETNLKWKTFQDLVDQIDAETQDINRTVHVFVIVDNDAVARLLNAIMRHGAVNVLKERFERFEAIRKANEGSAEALQLFGLKQDDDKNEDSNAAQETSTEPPIKKRYRMHNPAAHKRLPDDTITLTQIVRKMKNKEGEVITIADDEDTIELPSEPEDKEEKETNLHNLKLHYFSSRHGNYLGFETYLSLFKPMHIIMYDMDMHMVRQIELYQATLCHPKRCKLYTIQFEKSSEVQRYLSTLKREREAFENLIRDKASMVIPSGRDGKTDGHPDLIRGDIFKANETTDSANSRRAGGQIDRNSIIQQKVLVDMREFRCELPSIIHKRGLEIEPIQLEIGDYILSSDTCVERKSISDLIQSLQSGRLYNQAEMMTRHFDRSILLIEFDESKSFHFKGRYWGISTGHRDQSQDLIDRLICLTINFGRKLKLIWSPSTHFTAELFEYLKADRDEPDAKRIAAISSEELPPETFEDTYDIQVKNFLLKLPGINSRNVFAIMNRVPTIADLLDLSQEELHEIVGIERSAELLYLTLHSSLRKIANEAIQAAEEKKKAGLFACTKRKKGLI